MINKDVRKYLERKKVNEILIWMWKDSPDDSPRTHILEMTPYNGFIHINCIILYNILVSRMKNKLADLLNSFNCNSTIHKFLQEMGRVHPATPIATENLPAAGMANVIAKQKTIIMYC